MRRLLVLLLSLLLMSLVVQAQDSSPITPIIAVSNGDVYMIDPTDGSIKQLTHHPEITRGAGPTIQEEIAISADGQYLAYLQIPRFYALALKNNLVNDIFAAPEDIAILNLTTGEEKVVTSQQPNVKYSDTPRLWYRGGLKWAPTDNQLAYSQHRGEYGKAGYQSQLMIYDPLIDKTFTIVDGKDLFDEIAWVPEGFATGTTVWDTDGQVIARHYLSEAVAFKHRSVSPSSDYAIVDSIDVESHLGRVYLMDMETDEYVMANGYEATISALSPENSLVFIWGYNKDHPKKVVNPQTGATFVPSDDPPFQRSFTFSPDGKEFAYLVSGQSINISDLNGNDRVIHFKADAILWSTQEYTVTNEDGEPSVSASPTTDFYNKYRCGVLPPIGLVKGGQGKVIVGSGANRIRSAPYPDAETLGQIPEGATFNVVDGQQSVCNKEIRWAQVEYQGVTGWTAEGVDGQAFLEPVP